MTSRKWVPCAAGFKRQCRLRQAVVLCRRTIDILCEARTLRSATGLVFASRRGKTMSDMTLSKLLKEQPVKAIACRASTYRTDRCQCKEYRAHPWDVGILHAPPGRAISRQRLDAGRERAGRCGYSFLSRIVVGVRAARAAGMRQALNATTKTTAIADVSTVQSYGSTS